MGVHNCYLLNAILAISICLSASHQSPGKVIQRAESVSTKREFLLIVVAVDRLPMSLHPEIQEYLLNSGRKPASRAFDL
jgi:hypothetical protein